MRYLQPLRTASNRITEGPGEGRFREASAAARLHSRLRLWRPALPRFFESGEDESDRRKERSRTRLPGRCGGVSPTLFRDGERDKT